MHDDPNRPPISPRNAPQVRIRHMTAPVTVRGIGATRHSTDEYAILNIFIRGEKEGRPTIAHIKREAHLVNHLKANMLIGVDIMASEGMNVDFPSEILSIAGCHEFTTKVSCKVRSKDHI